MSDSPIVDRSFFDDQITRDLVVFNEDDLIEELRLKRKSKKNDANADALFEMLRRESYSFENKSIKKEDLIQQYGRELFSMGIRDAVREKKSIGDLSRIITGIKRSREN